MKYQGTKTNIQRADGRCDGFTSFATEFRSYQDNGRKIMKGSMKWNVVKVWTKSRHPQDSSLRRHDPQSVAQSNGQIGCLSMFEIRSSKRVDTSLPTNITSANVNFRSLFAFFSSKTTFRDFLFAIPNGITLAKWGLLLKEKKCSYRSKFFSLRVNLHWGSTLKGKICSYCSKLFSLRVYPH